MGACCSSAHPRRSSPYGAGSVHPPTDAPSTTDVPNDSSRANIASHAHITSTSSSRPASPGRDAQSFISQNTTTNRNSLLSGHTQPHHHLQPSIPPPSHNGHATSHPPQATTTTNTTTSPTTTTPSNPPLPNTRLKPPPPPPLIPRPPVHIPSTPTTPPPPLTRARLARERTEFFDTRVAGKKAIWGVVRLVAESLAAGDVDEAQALLDAAECTCPSGAIWGAEDGAGGRRHRGAGGVRALRREGGVYDAWGERYVVPAWVVGEPEGVLADGDGDDGGNGNGSGKRDVTMESGPVSSSSSPSASQREKGKGKATAAGQAAGGKRVRVRARLSDRGTDVSVRVGIDEPVCVLVERVREVAGISHPTTLRLAYLGRILSESESLGAQQWVEGHVVNGFVGLGNR